MSQHSNYARRYGVRFRGDLKSNLTPSQDAFPTLQPDPKLKEKEDYQRQLFYGFTSGELNRLDCLPTRLIGPGDLTNDILPMLQPAQWEVTPCQPDFTRNHLYPIKNGTGDWIMSNPLVNGIMQRPVQIASRVLSSVHLLPWFDALVYGPRNSIPIDRLEPKDQKITDRESFWPPANGQVTMTTLERDALFDELSNVYQLQWGFMDSAKESPQGPDQDSNDTINALGASYTNENYIRYNPTEPNIKPRAFVFIDLHEPEALLRTDLHAVDRMSLEWLIALTIVHETMHCLFMLRKLRGGCLVGALEPYYQDEAMAELGSSFENAFMSGQMLDFIEDGATRRVNPASGQLPLGYWHQRIFPTTYDLQKRSERVILTNPDPPSYNEMFPIPITFYEDVQRESFWDLQLRKYGYGLLRARGVSEGVRVEYEKSVTAPKREHKYLYKHDSAQRISGNHAFSTFNNLVRGALGSIALAANMSPADRKAINFGIEIEEGAKAGQAFWDGSEKQKQSVAEVQALIDGSSEAQLTPAEREAALGSVIEFTRKAIIHHQKTVAAFLAQNVAMGRRFSFRRLLLLTWNRATGSFLRQISEKAFSLGFNFDVEEDLIDLEQTRMWIFDPGNKEEHRTGIFWKEIQAVELARDQAQNGELQECKTNCDRILDPKNHACSLYVYCAAALLSFACQQYLSSGWDDRILFLNKIHLLLAKLKAVVPPAPSSWNDEIDKLGTDCERLLKLDRPLDFSSFTEEQLNQLDAEFQNAVNTVLAAGEQDAIDTLGEQQQLLLTQKQKQEEYVQKSVQEQAALLGQQAADQVAQNLSRTSRVSSASPSPSPQ